MTSGSPRQRIKNPARYRLDFIKENTLNTLWSVRMTRARVWAACCAIFAACAALIWVILAFTPLRQLLPGTLKGDLREQYIETALKLDSLEQVSRLNTAYIANLLEALNGPEEAASVAVAATAPSVPDSLLAASDAERQFVRSYEDEERFNLSVLAPLAAEGMIFSPPVASAVTVLPVPSKTGVSISGGNTAPVSAIYRGTVISSFTAQDGTTTVTIQHPNDFISVYQGLGDVFVEKGDKVTAAQRIGHIAPRQKLIFEFWHKGSPLDPRDYMPL